MRFSLTIGNHKYVLTLTPASLTLLMQVSRLSTQIPTNEREYGIWEKQLEEYWRLILKKCVDPRPRPEDEPAVMIALIQAGGEIMNKLSNFKLVEVENS